MMKKALGFLVLCLAFAGLCAFEGGGLFSSSINFDVSTPYTNKNPSYFSNVNKLSLWAKQNLDKDGFYNFSIQGSAYLKMMRFIKSNNKSLIVKTPLDLDMLKFSFFLPMGSSNSFSIDIGRKGLIDSTGIIVSQPFDGTFFKYKSPQVTMNMAFIFTTLLNANTVVLNESGYVIKNGIYYFPKSYAGFVAMFHIPILKTSYSIDIDSLNFFETKKNGKDKLYLTLGVNGPIIRRLFFSTYISGSFIKEYATWNSGILLTGAIAYYFNRYNAKFGFNMQYAKGGKNNFQSFTLRHISSQFYSPYTNVWNTGINASMKPIDELYLQALCNVICSATKKENASLYRGFEWFASAVYTIKKDIGVEASLGQYIEKNGSARTFIGVKGLISF